MILLTAILLSKPSRRETTITSSLPEDTSKTGAPQHSNSLLRLPAEHDFLEPGLRPTEKKRLESTSIYPQFRVMQLRSIGTRAEQGEDEEPVHEEQEGPRGPPEGEGSHQPPRVQDQAAQEGEEDESKISAPGRLGEGSPQTTFPTPFR